MFINPLVLCAVFYFVGYFWHEKTVGNKISSILCSALISYYSLSKQLYESLFCFLIYLFLDTFIRKDFLEVDILVHHISGAIISILFYISKNYFDLSNQNLMKSATLMLLNMEFTTPFLHLVWICKKYKHLRVMILCAVFLLTLWIPFRIIGSFMATKNLIFIILSDSPALFHPFICSVILFAIFLSSMLFFLQILGWFKIILIFVSEINKL